jgi:hypothetical protein
MGGRGKLRTSHLVIVGGILAVFLAAGWFDQPRPVLVYLQQNFVQLGLKNENFPNQIFYQGVSASNACKTRRMELSPIFLR